MREKHYTTFDLIRAAGRDNNKKRPYLLVNPLQGKHVPVSPKKALELFQALGEKVNESLKDGDKVLVIAFAETATAIGTGVAASLQCETYFMQTTRENIAGAEYLYFSESHSHATEQRLVRNGLEEMLQKVDYVIFAEDEVTTGNTIRHLITEIQNLVELPVDHFKIASLLNGMTDDIHAKFDAEGIERIYLVASDNESYAESLKNYAFQGECLEQDDLKTEIEQTAGAEKADGQSTDELQQIRMSGYLNARELVQMAKYKEHVQSFAGRVANWMERDLTEKKKEGESVLVLGTEEFMYPAIAAAGAVEQLSGVSEVLFHATTRSPILPGCEEDYPLHMRQRLDSVYEKERTTYLYNLKKYDRVLIITDAEIKNNPGVECLKKALKKAGNTEITTIQWEGTMSSSYKDLDVTILLKDITGLVEPQSTQEREKLIQGGRHYCEMLPKEYTPTEVYMQAYEDALEKYGAITAQAVGVLSDKIMKAKGKDAVLVSLARAGIPIGILIKRFIWKKYHIEVPHYAISIIRDRGIDHNAMKYILDRHKACDIQFVDGWIGKGAILTELKKDLSDYPEVSAELAVVADPANITELCGTHEDILIPSSCLNSTVSGLISRTFLRSDIIKETDFHGAVYYGEWEKEDLSEEFLNSIENHFNLDQEQADIVSDAGTGMDEVRRIMADFQVDNMNFVKPGIGEATRVLLRRVPWKVLISEDAMQDPMLAHLKRLAKEKGVEVISYPMKRYKACGIIKKMADV